MFHNIRNAQVWVVVRLHPMFSHFINLLGRSWDALMTRTSTNTLGFLLWTAALTLVVWLSNVAAKWWKARKKDNSASLRETILDSLWPDFLFTVGGALALVSVAWACSVVCTVYKEHQELVGEVRQLTANEIELQRSARDERHLLDVLQAFTVYRLRVYGGVPNNNCLVRSTAPSNDAHTQAKAVMVSQLANLASQCRCFGPMDTSASPEEQFEAESGMVDGKIVFHARQGDKAAEELFGILGSILPLQRSYDVPTNIPQYFFWLQYGRNVKWNAEPR
jgi:hypothetical protein